MAGSDAVLRPAMRGPAAATGDAFLNRCDPPLAGIPQSG